MKFDHIITNPPFTEKVNEKAYKPLDFPIYQLAMAENPSAEVVCLMRQSNKNRWKAGKYTDYDENITFPEVSCNVAIFVHDLKKPTIRIKSKYEENGMKPWIRENDISDTGKSLYNIIDRKTKFNKEEPIPEGYVAFHECSGKKIHAWKEGELPLKSNGKLCETLCYVKTSDPEKTKSWIMNEVSEQYATFIDRFKSGHVDRGFSKTVEVPEELRP